MTTRRTPTDVSSFDFPQQQNKQSKPLHVVVSAYKDKASIIQHCVIVHIPNEKVIKSGQHCVSSQQQIDPNLRLRRLYCLKKRTLKQVGSWATLENYF